MQISDSQLQEITLAGLGAAAVRLLLARDFPALSKQFGYAVTLGREVTAAIQEDLSAILADLGATGLDTYNKHSTTVSYFESNNAGLLAVVECIVPTNNGAAVLLELVVSSDGEAKHITLEQLSAAA
jgi:hypothetical protein